MRSSIFWLLLVLLLAVLGFASCGDGFDDADDLFVDVKPSGYVAPSTCMERLYYPLGLRTVALADFCYGAGGLQALHDQYRFGYTDLLDAATTLPLESLALERAHGEAAGQAVAKDGHDGEDDQDGEGGHSSR